MAEPLLALYLSIPGPKTIGRWQLPPMSTIKRLDDRLLGGLRAYLADAVDNPLLRLRTRDRIFPRIRQRREAGGGSP
jgi:hypothetical protein